VTFWHSVPTRCQSAVQCVRAAGCVTVTLQVRVHCVITVNINAHEMCVADVRLRPTFRAAAHLQLHIPYRASVCCDAGCHLGDVGCAQLNVLVVIFTDFLEMKNHSLCPFRGRLYAAGGQSSADRRFVALSDWSRVLLATSRLVSDSSIVRRVRKISFSAHTIMLCDFSIFCLRTSPLFDATRNSRLSTRRCTVACRHIILCCTLS